jgi:hypothetical protein
MLLRWLGRLKGESEGRQAVAFLKKSSAKNFALVPRHRLVMVAPHSGLCSRPLLCPQAQKSFLVTFFQKSNRFALKNKPLAVGRYFRHLRP